MNISNPSDFSLWQKRLVDFFWSNKGTDPNFLERVGKNHPNYSTGSDMTDAQKEFAESAVISRMKNYGRKNKTENGFEHYARCPYLDDLYALCASKDLTPNDILFDSLNSEIESMNSFEDLFFVMSRNPIAKKLFEDVFNVSKRDFSSMKAEIPRDKTFRLIFVNCILTDFSNSFKYCKTSKVHDGPEEKDYFSYNINTEEFEYDFLYDILELIGNSNGKTIAFVINHSKIRSSLCGGSWKYDPLESLFEDLATPMCQNYQAWNKKKQFLISLNYYFLNEAVKALRKTCNIYLTDEEYEEEIEVCRNMILDGDEFLRFFRQIFSNCFIKINHTTVIDWSGQLFLEESTEEQGRPNMGHHEESVADSDKSPISKLGTNKSHIPER